MLRTDLSVLHGETRIGCSLRVSHPRQAESQRRHRSRNLADLIDFGGLVVRGRHSAPGMEHRYCEKHDRNDRAGWGAPFETQGKAALRPYTCWRTSCDYWFGVGVVLGVAFGVALDFGVVAVDFGLAAGTAVGAGLMIVALLITSSLGKPLSR